MNITQTLNSNLDESFTMAHHDPSLKHKRSKSRELSSLFSSPISSSEYGISSPVKSVSPARRKSISNSPGDQRKHRKHEDSGLVKGQLWPSSSSASVSSSDRTSNSGTLAEFLGNDRLKDFVECKDNDKRLMGSSSSRFSLNRQSSCADNIKFENERDVSKGNHRRSFMGGSMRYTGTHKSSPSSPFSPSSSSSSVKLKSNNSVIVPGRLSIHENALYQRRRYDSFCSDSEFSDQGSDFSSSFTGSSSSSRKSGIEVPSKYMNDISAKSRSETLDSCESQTLSSDNLSNSKRFSLTNAIRGNLHSGSKSSISQWALSPGRTGSPPFTLENKGKLMGFSTVNKPALSRKKGMEKILNLGLDFLKGKKSSPNSSLSSTQSTNSLEDAFRLRLLDNRLMQWRYANAKVEAVNARVAHQAECDLLCAWDCLTKLRVSVQHKKLQFQKQKLVMKLNFIFYSQMKLLEAWEAMERQHPTTISKTNECLYAVACSVPLIQGAKVDTQLASLAIRHASHCTTSVESMLSGFSQSAETAVLLSELAEVAKREKVLLEECFELLSNIYATELEERSLQCNIIQSKLWYRRLEEGISQRMLS